jgi:hypothetical protein
MAKNYDGTEVKDYSNETLHDVQFCTPGFYKDGVMRQNKMQPRYCEPGEAGDAMHGEKRNTQHGPKI